MFESLTLLHKVFIINNLIELMGAYRELWRIDENVPPKGTRENSLRLKIGGGAPDFSVRKTGSALSNSRGRATIRPNSLPFLGLFPDFD